MNARREEQELIIPIGIRRYLLSLNCDSCYKCFNHLLDTIRVIILGDLG